MNVNWSIERYDEVHSTQDELKALALKGAGEGQVVTAKSQNGGRGRHGRVWVSEPGNLYFSLLLRPSCGLNAIGQLALIVGASIGAVRQKSVHWEACDDARELGRHILGAALMGFGGVLALGCTIGQGLSAASLLTFSAPIVICSIAIGARIGLAYLLGDRAFMFS